MKTLTSAILFAVLTSTAFAQNLSVPGTYSSSTGYSKILTNSSTSNFGIGTSAPDALLHVSGADLKVSHNTFPKINVRLDAMAEPAIIFRRWTGTADVSHTAKIGQFFIGAGEYALGFGLGAFNGATLPTTHAMTIRLNGNVGIGTDDPGSYKLAVNGSINAAEVKVTATIPGPDYVFEKDYKLPTLGEIESYITKNKHLPEVPSAKEMEENGLQLGEMNLLLLKKIEELTLYMIEQQKRIEQLETKVK